MRKSMSMRILVESVLVEAGADMQNQFKVTTEALQLNIQQIKSVKNQLEEKLPMVGLRVWFNLLFKGDTKINVIRC